MNTRQNITIGLLLLTAIILGAMVVSTYTASPAYAASSIKQGDYIMVTGAASDKIDLLYVVDIAARRLNAYYVDFNTSSIELMDSVDLKQVFASN